MSNLITQYSSDSQRLEKIIELLSKSSFVTAAQVENPYKEFTKTIANNEIIFIDYSYNYFRLLTATSTTGLTFRFGQAGTPTPMVGAGIGIGFPQVLDRIAITNTSGGAVTITVGLGVGIFDDNRLNISGNVSVINATSTALQTHDVATVVGTLSDVSVGTSVTTIFGAAALRKETWLTNMDTANIVYVGDTNVNTTTRRGYPLYPGQTAIFSGSPAVSGITASGTANVAILYYNYSF